MLLARGQKGRPGLLGGIRALQPIFYAIEHIEHIVVRVGRHIGIGAMQSVVLKQQHGTGGSLGRLYSARVQEFRDTFRIRHPNLLILEGSLVVIDWCLAQAGMKNIFEPG